MRIFEQKRSQNENFNRFSTVFGLTGRSRNFATTRSVSISDPYRHLKKTSPLNFLLTNYYLHLLFSLPICMVQSYLETPVWFHVMFLNNFARFMIFQVI